MTDHSALIERLEGGADRFLKWTYKHHYSGPPVVSIPRHPDNIDALLHEAAAALRDQQVALEKWKRLKGYADDQVKVERAAYRSLLADHEGRPLPSAPNQAKPET